MPNPPVLEEVHYSVHWLRDLEEAIAFSWHTGKAPGRSRMLDARHAGSCAMCITRHAHGIPEPDPRYQIEGTQLEHGVLLAYVPLTAGYPGVAGRPATVYIGLYKLGPGAKTRAGFDISVPDRSGILRATP